jgi:hypothetical protein
MKALIALVAALAAAPPAAPSQEPAPERRRVDIVFCVDRSGSMQQVIETAKQKVWSIVNETAKAKPSPILRIGLIGYGTADRDIKFFPLSDDLDKVYENLSTFKVDMGGDEWVGWAAQQAAERMEWAKEKGALKIVFMVGNETAAQGRPEVLYAKTVPEIIKKDILVNAVYCGRPNANEEKTWREVAQLADGAYTQIDLSGGAITIETPQDKKLLELNQKLNATYLAFGATRAAKDEAEHKKVAQEAADAATQRQGGAPAAAERAVSKGGALYRNASWDLVDASKEKEFDLAKLKPEDLPKEMQGLTLEERKAFLEKKRQEREALQKEIAQTSAERQKHMDAEIKRRNLTQDSAFDEAVRKTIRTQAAKKGFTFEETSPK